uniref:hypothetical protein n=1 Tax=Piscirickettsia salmonis TaxID=1238 RepID=UPI0039F6754F
MESAVKKTLKHPKANENTRTSFQNKIKRYAGYGRPIVYLDESGFATDMPRKRGYSCKAPIFMPSLKWNFCGFVSHFFKING